MQRNDPGVFRHLAQAIEKGVVSGAYPPGRPLPSIRTLAGEHNVAAMTVQRALKVLSRSGRVRAVPGVGVFPANGCPLDAIALVTDEQYLTQTLDPFSHLRLTTLDVLAGAKRACTEEGIHLLTVTENDDPQKLLDRRTGFLMHFGDYQLTPLTRWATTLLRAKEPCVAIGYDNGLPSFVDRDVPGAYEKGLRYFHQLGHRRVLLVTRPIAGKTPVVKPLPDLLDLQVRTYVSAGRPESTVQQEVSGLIAESLGGAPEDRVTAVLAGPGNLARPALAAMEAAGLSVPRDCSLVGFCSAQHAQLEGRRISRLDNAWQAIAHRAVKELLGIAATGKDAGWVLVSPEMVEGDTCAAAPQANNGNGGGTTRACMRASDALGAAELQTDSGNGERQPRSSRMAADYDDDNNDGNGNDSPTADERR